LLSQLPVLGVASHGGLDGGQFLGGNIPGVVFAILPMLELVVGAGGVRTLFKGVGGERSPLHGGNGGDLLQKASFIGWIHHVTMFIVTHPKKYKACFSI
jgi:hypothetical protein